MQTIIEQYYVFIVVGPHMDLANDTCFHVII